MMPLNEREPIRVLIVDDDPDDHLLTGETLGEARRENFTTTHAYTVDEAFAAMVANEHDVCLLDYSLGATDGIALFREAKAKGYARPAILLTGHDDDELADRVLSAGLSDYLVKSRLDGPTLERTIRYTLERARSAAEIQRLNESLERRVEERTADLTAANRELESLCYSISHDLRAPLRAIHSASSILLEEYDAVLDEEAKQELLRQARASSRMDQLIDGMLRFVRLRNQNLQRNVLDLSALSAEVASQIGIPAEIEAGIQVQGDRALVAQALQQFVDNAFKFGARQVWIGREEDAVYVRDNGPGFDMAYAEKIFMPFQRLHRDDVPGTGIGLAHARRIVERHGGRLWVHSKVGCGTCFYFTLG